MNPDNANSTKRPMVLVTGATGMLGSCLTGYLLDHGFDVKAIYRNKNRMAQFKNNLQFFYPGDHQFSGTLSWEEADILDATSLNCAAEGVSAIYHMAAMVSFDPRERNRLFETNIKGTANLVNAAIENQVPRFIHVSSIAALGPSEDGRLIDENCHWVAGKKNSGYSISKFHSEMEVWRGIEEGLGAVVVNPSVILGPGDWRSGSPAFFYNLYNKLRFYPKGSTGFVDVRDVAEAMFMLSSDENFTKARGNRYLLNVANLSYRDMFAMVAKALGVDAPSLAASGWMLGLAWRLAWLGAKLTGTKPLITRESISAANHQSNFSGDRITREFGFKYRAIETTINEIAGMFIESH